MSLLLMNITPLKALAYIRTAIQYLFLKVFTFWDQNLNTDLAQNNTFHSIKP